MQTTKILQWLLTFGVLTAFTVHTVGQVQEQSRLIAFAQTMEETESVRARLYIVASPVDPSSSIFDRFLERVAGYAMVSEELCSLSEEQYALLADAFTFEATSVDLGDQTVSVFTLETNTLTHADIAAVLDASGEGEVPCTVIEYSGMLLFPATFQLS